MTDTNAAARADIAKLERTLLRDIAGIRGTLPPALAAVENFIEEWLRDTYQYNWVQQLVPYCDPPPMQFYDAYDKWRAGQPREEWLENQPPHELDDPVERLFWDADAWNSMQIVHQWRLPARDLDEAVLLEIFGIQRAICHIREVIWPRRYPNVWGQPWIMNRNNAGDTDILDLDDARRRRWHWEVDNYFDLERRRHWGIAG
jgi:hypothetical protein